MKTKKFLSLVLSAAMILGVAVPVAAEPVSAGQGVEAEQQPIPVEKNGKVPAVVSFVLICLQC